MDKYRDVSVIYRVSPIRFSKSWYYRWSNERVSRVCFLKFKDGYCSSCHVVHCNLHRLLGLFLWKLGVNVK